MREEVRPSVDRNPQRREFPRISRDYFIRVVSLGENGAHFHGRTRDLGRKGVYAILENVEKVSKALEPGEGVEVRIYREDSDDLKGFTLRGSGLVGRVESLEAVGAVGANRLGVAIVFSPPLELEGL
jgi:ATP-dependent RNA circularization protein (DNA/RNA ligase family)